MAKRISVPSSIHLQRMQRPLPAPWSPQPRVRRLPNSSLCKSLSMDMSVEFSSLPPIPPSISTIPSPQLSPLIFRKRSCSSTPFQKEAKTASHSPTHESDNLDLGPAISLSQIVESHSNYLPLQVKVSGSLYGVCGTASLVDGESLNLHFVKETKYVRAMVAESRELKVPINSSLEFSLLYNPAGDLTDAMEGKQFVSVNDLMSANPLPLIVCVTEQHSSPSQLISGDILVLKKMKKKSFGSGYLVCHNIRKNQEVRLTEKSKVQLSTKPHLVRLHLPQLIKHIRLPQKVVVSAKDETQWSQLRCYFPNNACTLLSSATEVSFIASYSNKEISRAVLEIPTSLSYPVHIKKPSAVVKQQLLNETEDLLNEFQPRMVSMYVSERISSKLELTLRKCVCEDDWREGVVLKKPDNMEQTDDQYEYLPHAVRHKDVVDANEEELQQLRKLVRNLQEKVKTLEEQNSIETPQDYVVMRSPLSNTIANRQSLGLLTCNQVLHLLDAMKLGDYKSNFEREQITGDLMMVLDDSILEQELGVKTRIHRIKLMKVIAGEYPVGRFMKQDEEQ